MVAMGFKDDDSRKALKAEGNDIGDAVRRLIKAGKRASASASA